MLALPAPRLLKATRARRVWRARRYTGEFDAGRLLPRREMQSGFVGRTVGTCHEKPLGWRQKDQAEARLAVFDQCDVDRKLRFAANKETRTVERINEEKPACVFASSASRDPFLGNDRDVGRDLGKRRKQHALGLMIGCRNRRPVSLLHEFHTLREMRHLEAAGLAYRRKQRIDQGVMILGVDRQHGASKYSGSNRYSANAVARGQCLLCTAAKPWRTRLSLR